MSLTPPRLPPGERLRRAGIGAWSIIGLVIVLALVGWVLLKISVIFAPLGLALLIIYLLNPIVTRFEERRVPRLGGTLLAYVVVLGGITLLVMMLVPYVSTQVENFSEDWPQFRGEIISYIDETAADINDRFGTNLDTTQIDCLLGADTAHGVEGAPSDRRCNQVTRDFRKWVADHAGDFTDIGRNVLEFLLVFVLAPLIAFYLLVDLPEIQRDLLALVPENHRDEVSDVAAKIGRAVGGFFRGQLLVALLVGIMSAIGFSIIGLKYALLIGAIAGFFNLVPLVGPYIGGAIGFFVGVITGGVALGLKAALVELIVQQLDNHIISPNVMKRTVQLHPATVMLALLAGGALAGFWGVLLGVPAIAVIKLIAGHVWATRVLGVEPTPFAAVAARPYPAEGSSAAEGGASSSSEVDPPPISKEDG